ncbi:hypothetical protein Tco_1190638, partial [Tanacetum coccineum]
ERLEDVNGSTDNVSEYEGRSVWPDIEFVLGSRLSPTRNMWKCNFCWRIPDCVGYSLGVFQVLSGKDFQVGVQYIPDVRTSDNYNWYQILCVLWRVVTTSKGLNRSSISCTLHAWDPVFRQAQKAES